MTKRVLTAVPQVLPDEGPDHLTRLDIRRGWGDVLNVRIHTTMSRSTAGREFAAKLREAIDDALGDERHAVEIVWGAIG